MIKLILVQIVCLAFMYTAHSQDDSLMRIRPKVSRLMAKIDGGNKMPCDEKYDKNKIKLLKVITSKEIDFVCLNLPSESVFVVLMEWCIEDPNLLSDSVLHSYEVMKNNGLFTCHYIDYLTVEAYLCFRMKAKEIEVPPRLHGVLFCQNEE